MYPVYRIDMSRQEIKGTELDNSFCTFGNRGLVAAELNENVDPACNPLGPDNKLVFCTGIFAGTAVPAAHRLSIGAKSPLTGGIKETNVGGNAGYYLAGHGIRMIVIEGQPPDDEWNVIFVDQDGCISLLPGNKYRGMDTYHYAAEVRKEFGREIALAVVGVAAERHYPIASIMVSERLTGNPCRAAGRGGLGAVMASKQIKGLVIQKPVSRCKPSYADRQKFISANKKLADHILQSENIKRLNKVGTMGAIDAMSMLGVTPVRNFSGALFADAEVMSSEVFVEKLKKNGGKNSLACQPGCLVRCSNYYCNKKGEYVTGGFEYGTAVLFGPNCAITDYDFIAEMDRFCDNFGIDSIEAATMAAICMETGRISWGDEDGIRSCMRELSEGTEFGNIMGLGTDALGKYLGAMRIPTVKRQAISGYDPRNIKGLGVTYATSPMGADHTAGFTFVGNMNHRDRKGQKEKSEEMQIKSALVDNIGCYFDIMPAFDIPEVLPLLMEGRFGGTWTLDDMLRIGEQTLRWEKEFNLRAGLSERDDKLPEFFYKEKTETGTVFDVE